VVVTCSVFCNFAHAQSRLEAEYIASIANIPVGEGAWVVTINDNEYTAEATGHVIGLLRWITTGEGSAVARGTVSNGHLSAANYSANVKSKKKFQTLRMELKSGTVQNVVIEPPDPPNKKSVPVTEADRRKIIDPMTAALIPVAGAGEVLKPSGCEQILSVFDGTQRFNLALSYKRMEEVQADKGYRGPALVCSVNYQPIAGHNPNRFAIKYLMNSRDMEIWLTPMAGARVLVPFRISIPTTIGIAVLQARQFVVVAPELSAPR
jgi:hypothetical protein